MTFEEWSEEYMEANSCWNSKDHMMAAWIAVTTSSIDIDIEGRGILTDNLLAVIEKVTEVMLTLSRTGEQFKRLDEGMLILNDVLRILIRLDDTPAT